MRCGPGVQGCPGTLHLLCAGFVQEHGAKAAALFERAVTRNACVSHGSPASTHDACRSPPARPGRPPGLPGDARRRGRDHARAARRRRRARADRLRRRRRAARGRSSRRRSTTSRPARRSSPTRRRLVGLLPISAEAFGTLLIVRPALRRGRRAARGGRRRSSCSPPRRCAPPRPSGTSRKTLDASVQSLAALLDLRDGYTGQHSSTVVRLCEEVGRRVGVAGAELEHLRIAAHLHDLGKIGVPDQILHKPGPLDDAEWSIMREHPVWGARALEQIPGFRAASLAVRHHHERWDGQGLPGRPRGREDPARRARHRGLRRLRGDDLDAPLPPRPRRARWPASGSSPGPAPSSTPPPPGACSARSPPTDRAAPHRRPHVG